jgi:hypothetical protein
LDHLAHQVTEGRLKNRFEYQTRNAKRRDPVALSRAIDEWEQDLMFLYERYYLGLVWFGWPVTEPFDA